MQCGPGNGRRTSGGGDKVPHNGWPAVTGILWKVLDSGGHKKVGGPDNDELLGHHGSDRLFGGAGKDILWGDWDPSNNNTHQKDLLDGGPGNDWIYPSHGPTVVKGGAGKDYVWAYYGRGTIDCGPGQDTARVKLNGPWKVRNCERVLHFCAFGSDGHGGCLKPGEKKPTGQAPRSRRVGRGSRRPLSDRAVKAAISSRTIGSEPAGPSTVSVRASGSSRSSRRRNEQQRRSAATKAASALARVAARTEAQNAAGGWVSAESRSRAMAAISRAPRGHLGFGEACRRWEVWWTWE